MHVKIGRKHEEWIPRVPSYLFVLIYLAVPVVLLFVNAHVIGAIEDREINLEFLLIGAISVILPRSLCFAMLVSEFFLDCVYQICVAYDLTPTQLFAIAHYLPLLPASRIVGGGIALLFGAVLCGALSLLRPKRNEQSWAAGTLLLLMACLLGADMCTGKNFLWRRDAESGMRIVRSPLTALVRRESFYQWTLWQSGERRDDFARSASANLITKISGGSVAAEHKANVVLVLVESWGLMDDARAAQGLVDAYANPLITSSYAVEHGTVDFHGGTVSGEARELCESGMGYGMLQISEKRAVRCLPDLLREQGYHTVGIHGFTGEMFLRKRWYPRMGFDESWFRSDLESAGLPRCSGAFSGICDSSIAQFIGQRLLNTPSEQPQFIYWVTLNSHIPVPARTDIADDGSCESRLRQTSSPALCSWYRLVRAVHKGVAEDSIKLIGRPTVFLIVGDHMPFGDPALRRRFSQTEVPYILLVPTSLEREREGPTGWTLDGRMRAAKNLNLRTTEGMRHVVEPKTSTIRQHLKPKGEF